MSNNCEDTPFLVKKILYAYLNRYASRTADAQTEDTRAPLHSLTLLLFLLHLRPSARTSLSIIPSVHREGTREFSIVLRRITRYARGAFDRTVSKILTEIENKSNENSIGTKINNNNNTLETLTYFFF